MTSPALFIHATREMERKYTSIGEEIEELFVMY